MHVIWPVTCLQLIQWLISIHNTEAHGRQHGWSSITDQYSNIKWWQKHRTDSRVWHGWALWVWAFQGDRTPAWTQWLHNPSEKPRISMSSTSHRNWIMLCAQRRSSVVKLTEKALCFSARLLTHANSEPYL